MQQSENQAERQKLEEKWHLFLKNVWGCMQSQITERMQELGAFVKQDVKGGLGVMSGMFRGYREFSVQHSRNATSIGA